jgi:hypothetical protein
MSFEHLKISQKLKLIGGIFTPRHVKFMPGVTPPIPHYMKPWD